MDLQKTNDESLNPSETEIPTNTIDVISRKDSEKDVNSKLEVKCPETDDNTLTETKTAQNGEANQKSEEEEKKENIDNIVNEKLEDKKERRANNLLENPRLDISEDQNEKPVENGIFDDDTASKNLELLWAEAIKAQNEGRYKDAIRSFTAIYDVSWTYFLIFFSVKITSNIIMIISVVKYSYPFSF